jgi:hypothetical protein
MTIDITPDVSLLKKSGEVNYKIPDAIAELVDNSVDERIPGHKLHVEVTTGQRKGQKFIRVDDDGVGMDKAGVAKAMVMGYSRKKPGQIGEFGLGLKTACSNLGSKFELITATEAAEKAIRLVYDEEEFLDNGRWEMVMEEVDKPFEHGTSILITEPKVNVYPGVKDSILGKFGKIFKHFVAAGEVEIIVNNTQVEPSMPDTIPEYDTEINFEVNGKLVRGWASLLKHASPKGGYGFDLVRHNRVMIEHEKLGFSPQAALARLVGELHLDDFPVVNNKTDFRRDTSDWDQMVKRLNEEFLADLKREARKKANPGKLAPKDEAEVEEFMEDVKEALKNDALQADLDRRALDSDLADEFTEGPLPFTTPSADGDEETPETPEDKTDVDDGRSTTDGWIERGRPTTQVGQQRLHRVKTQLRNLSIEHQIARLGRDSLYKVWDIEGVANRKKLVVTTNQDHPMYAAIEADFTLWVKHNIVEAVAEFFTDSTGKTEQMLLIKSDILKHVSKMKLEIVEAPTYVINEDNDEASA